MIDQKHALPMARQAKLLDMSRSSIYYRPQPVSEITYKSRFPVQPNGATSNVLNGISVAVDWGQADT